MPIRGAISDLPLFAAVSEEPPARAPDICANRHGGAATSRLAQLDRAGRASEQRARVYQAILDASDSGLTVDELAGKWDQPPNRLSGRFSELKAAGLLRAVGLRKTRAGSAAMAYAVAGNADLRQDAPSKPKP